MNTPPRARVLGGLLAGALLSLVLVAGGAGPAAVEVGQPAPDFKLLSTFYGVDFSPA